MKEDLQKAFLETIEAYCAKKGFSLPANFQLELDLSRDKSHGDLTTPAAFRLSKLANDKPLQVARDLLALFNTRAEKEKLITKSEIAGAGFINFFIPRSLMAEILVQIQQKDSEFGHSKQGAGKKVMIEFVSANPTGPLTIAHGRQAVIGDALARIFSVTGHQVTKEYYLNDTGRQIGLLGESLWVRYQELFGVQEKVPNEGYKGDYLKEIAAKLKKEKGDSITKKPRDKAIEECRNYAAKEILEGIKEDLKAVRVEFDSYFSEHSLREKKMVEKVIGRLKEKNFIFEQGEALWFRSTDFGDDKDRVLRKQTGDYTYLAPDIAYHWTKFERGFDRMINLWGPDHHGYIARMMAACQALGYPAKEQLKVLIVQLVTLYRQGQPVRMSTRSGEFVTLRELFEEVGVDATRFFFLLRRVESHLDFDLDLAKKKSDDNPVFYLQYAHARISSILKFSERKINPQAKLDRLGAPEETDLMKKLQEYPEILIHAAEGMEPYRVVEYLRELAAGFHKFYALHRVVSEDEELTAARLVLADSVRIVLRNGLAVLGVSQPEKM